MSRSLVVEADGGSRGNPGRAGYGALVRDRRTGAVLAERAASVGIASNNVAEYSGLVAGLEAALDIDPAADVEARMDSKLVVEQMSGRWKIRHQDMQRLAAVAGELCERLSAAGGSVRFTWVPRAENGAADALANAAMDGFTIDRRLDAGPAGHGGPAGLAGPADPEPSAGARLVLVRHGVTAFTAAGKLDGRGGADPSLSALGRDQAGRAGRAVAAALARHGSIDGVRGPQIVSGPANSPGRVTVLTSSLARARQTGEAVAAALGVDAEVDADWDEQDFGDWDGKSMLQLAARFAPELERFRADPAYARPGGETHEALAERVLSAFGRATARTGTVVVATHRKPLMVVLAHVLAIPHDRIWRLATAPASLTGIELDPSGGLSVSYVNDTAHLRPDPPASR